MNAFGGGCYGLTGAKDVPADWLEGSPFHTYFTPSVVLFVVVGGAAFAAGLMVLSRHPKARKATAIAALILFIWLAVQVAMIGYVSWLQPTVAIAGLLIFILSLKLPKHEN
jgi:peptidoglycan/LPS O-acetylase OafA/YrhL